VGEPLEQSGVVLTVLSSERVDSFEDNTAAAGNDLVVLEVQIANNSSESAQVQRFEIEDSQGNQWNVRQVAPQELKSFLGFGETIQFQIVSEIPEPLSGLQLTYVPFDDEEDASTMRVALDDMAPVAGGQDQPADGGTAQEPPPDAPVGTVTNGGNLRSEPRVAPGTVIAQVCPNDQIEFLSQQGGWYRVRVYATAADCVANRAAAGTEGWVSSTLLSQPSAAVPAEGAQTGGDGGGGGGDGGGDGMVNNGGNLRSEPRIAPETVLGQVCPGDTIDILDQQQTGGILWYQIRVTATAQDCHPERVSVDTQGWLSSVLVTRR
jgi:hypothetical protein